MQLSSLLNRFNEPETLKMAKLGRELRAKGIDVIDLSLGEPDFDTPQHIKDAAIKAINDNWSHYTPVAGFADLREAVCTKLKRDNGLDYLPENIITSTGAKQSLANAILALVDEGDEVIIPTPYWVTYSELVKIARGKVVEIRTSVANQFKATPEQVEAAITPATRVFMFSSPCNPTGSVYSKEELAALVAVFKKHPQIIIISDEIYEYINYEGNHESIAQFEEVKDRVLVVNGMSKGFAMTGWRIGYLAGPKRIVQACEKLQGQFTSGTNSIAQKASIAALTGDMTPTHEMTAAFKARRDFVIDALGKIPGVKINHPKGAFYAFPDISSFFGKTDGNITINNDEDLCMYLLHQAHVSTVNGAAFGNEQCIRLSFATSLENLKKGIARMAEALGKLK
ncbi:MAG: pyridoxal phosphate-dependent aminotransferase [Sediminibacterium sp.]|nr:pyridoxal phosphate-dependent aminotransferase [Sediminibacterium sp.]